VRALIAAGVAPEEVDEGRLRSHLYAPEMPDPDLVIRTSGEMRMSNFLLWQSAYAEFAFEQTLWPDFGGEQLAAALHAYAGRQRRFGRR
jgi:undecaprenyl diphosphate synthase